MLAAWVPGLMLATVYCDVGDSREETTRRVNDSLDRDYIKSTTSITSG